MHYQKEVNDEDEKSYSMFQRLLHLDERDNFAQSEQPCQLYQTYQLQCALRYIGRISDYLKRETSQKVHKESAALDIGKCYHFVVCDWVHSPWVQVNSPKVYDNVHDEDGIHGVVNGFHQR